MWALVQGFALFIWQERMPPISGVFETALNLNKLTILSIKALFSDIDRL